MKHAGSINRDGFTLRYSTEGAGPDTLVIGSSVYYSRSFSQDLRQHLRLHFVDYRGFAKGPKGSLEFVTLLEDIEEVRKALGLSKFIIIGHSAHGLLALEYAKKYPEYISHVVIIGMPPHMKEDNQALAKRHWDEAICPERKAALEHNFQLMPDSKLNALPRDEWFLQMNLRNSPKAWYNPPLRFQTSLGRRRAKHRHTRSDVSALYTRSRYHSSP